MDKVLALFAALLAASPAHVQLEAADNYPNRPAKVIIIVAPGAASTLPTRIVGQKLHTRFGQPLVIENRPGAGGNIG